MSNDSKNLGMHGRIELDPLRPTSGNIRDLGGLRTVDGRCVRSGVLYRSEALSTLDDHHRRALSHVPFRLVLDLRGHGEGEASGRIWASDAMPTIAQVEIIAGTRARDPDVSRRALNDPSGRVARQYMRDLYAEMVEGFSQSCLANVVDWIADQQQLPALIHCTAGKDRTGFLVALLLLALGVPHEAVIADYMKSNEHYGLDRIRNFVLETLDPPFDGEFTPETIAPLSASPEYLELALDMIVRQYGSIENYWIQGARGDRRAVERLRNALLD